MQGTRIVKVSLHLTADSAIIYQNGAPGDDQPKHLKKYLTCDMRKARNIIETCFGALKQRWAILRSPCYYNVKMTAFIIHACAILHNFFTKEVPNDLLDTIIPEGKELGIDDDASNEQAETISTVGSTNAWTSFRDELAMSLWNDYRASHH
ncbi:hypothetical protein Scep_014339 [Stephania cephalantha]|uniref:DDE Tnp4 domain-containing protein n=1 Tax=Stephania cephalantha TaxID=152367 RepID=A0AAP0J2X9_9MAGN